MRIVIVGVGGVGTQLLPALCRFLDNREGNAHIVLLDGDRFEESNATRQDFDRLGSKAEVTKEALSRRFPRLEIEAKTTYVSEDNVFVYFDEEDIVFCCVDNHASRKLLNDRCAELSSATLISGGNEYSDGNVQVYVRKDGVDITPPITYLHPEIADPQDRNPAHLSCEELAQAGAPQLIFANLAVASHMLNTFWLVTENRLSYSELYFDLVTGAVRSVNRKGN
ncbi:MAG TPA: ThiF family adenylyltransferase [Candidatus Paceibacterota bacterium]|nr:ThiF family adenylyltransferase [Candidatus Paceibacterota bacterium]